MGNAISYALNQWAKLGGFLRDGCVHIDNSLVENTVRPSAIGTMARAPLRSSL